MFSDLEGKVVIITGGSGIGKSFAENFGKSKAKVVLNYRSDRHLDEIEEIKHMISNGGEAIAVQAMWCRGRCKTISSISVKEFGTLDIMINNAGFENLSQPIKCQLMNGKNDRY